ncbi:MAG: GNAT family N-acetyltransferase [Leptolyngbyaceae cyanobacterium HOT.MB2.61]|jgi:amino-acid N-acetyltransferase|nr:GNAT family N-acetyltransferase [Leptolyngbyaceae cyanobacterium HOT.MB2.61]
MPPGYTLRPACAEDIGTIRKLVLSALLDPTQLRWSQFWVMEQEGKIIACGQLRNFPDAQELGSVVVVSALRGQGLGSQMVQHLVEQATKPLYLECLGQRLARFYAQFGFVPVSWQELPPSLKRKFGLSALAARVLRVPVNVMQYRKGTGADSC